MSQVETLPKCYAKNYIWIANNISFDAKSLQLEEIQGLTNIFYEFIEVFQGSYDDELTLCEIVRGLMNLAKVEDEKSL